MSKRKEAPVALKGVMTQRKLIGFSLKLSPTESAFVAGIKAKRGGSAADVIRGFINAFRTWFDLPQYIADELRKQAEARGIDEMMYIRELLAREYERSVHGNDGRRPSAQNDT